MKLPATLLQTLALAVASAGMAGCGSATSGEPTPSPGVVEPQGSSAPQENTQGCEPAHQPNDAGVINTGDDVCPACGRG